MSEEQVCKEKIELVGYQEFYRYFQEKTTLIEQQRKEIERLNNIIEEVREYLNKNEIEEVYLDCKLYETKVYKDILEILDKVGSDKE